LNPETDNLIPINLKQGLLRLVHHVNGLAVLCRKGAVAYRHHLLQAQPVPPEKRHLRVAGRRAQGPHLADALHLHKLAGCGDRE